MECDELLCEFVERQGPMCRTGVDAGLGLREHGPRSAAGRERVVCCGPRAMALEITQRARSCRIELLPSVWFEYVANT